MDLDEIFASFKQQYNINLFKENIKWKEFVVLLNNLNENTPLLRKIQVRNMKDNDIKDFNLRKYKQSIMIRDENEKDVDSLLLFANKISS